MKNTNPKNEKIGRLIVAGFGVLWTTAAFSITADSPWPVARIVLPAFGILFTIGALLGHSSESSNPGDEEENTTMESPVEQFNPKEMDAPGQTGRKEPPVQAPAPQPRQKKYVFCPYCGTAQAEDYKICESCGAGRKEK